MNMFLLKRQKYILSFKLVYMYFERVLNRSDIKDGN